jgi:hypothetical protein
VKHWSTGLRGISATAEVDDRKFFRQTTAPKDAPANVAPPCGLNPNDVRDGTALAANGYTNVENYLNKLAGDPIP